MDTTVKKMELKSQNNEVSTPKINYNSKSIVNGFLI